MLAGTSRRSCSVSILIGVLLSLFLAPAAMANTGSISGTAFEDLNRDGVRQAGEKPLAGHTIYIYTLEPFAIAAGTSTDANGNYAFSGLAAGGYRVTYQMTSWSSMWTDWTPTTTGSPRPTVDVQLNGAATVDFGWRPITRSTDPSKPVSSFTGANGLRAESFNDVVSAREVYDAVMRGLVGPEAAFTTVRFDLSPTSSTSAGFAGGPGSFSNFNAVSYNDWITWLRYGDYGISHEHGHVWAAYHEHIVQQDGDFSGYLQARGLTGDSRVGTSYTWDVGELIAEDYRLLFGSAEAKQRPHMNPNIPAPKDVAGLEDYLRNTFMTASANTTPKPTPEPSPAPDTTAPSPAGSVEAVAAKGAITVKWAQASDQGGSGVETYEVWRRSGKTAFSKVATTTATSFSDAAVRRGTVYSYYVVTIDGAGNRSASSNQASAKAL